MGRQPPQIDELKFQSHGFSWRKTRAMWELNAINIPQRRARCRLTTDKIDSSSPVLPSRPLPPSRVPDVYVRCFSTPPPVGHTGAAQRLTAGTWVLGREYGCWSRLRSERVASGPQFTAELTRSVTEPGEPGTCRCALLHKIMHCVARETCLRAPYRCLPGMSLTGEQTGHTGALCVC